MVEGEVADRGHHPHRVGGFGGGPIHVARQVLARAVGQSPAQMTGLQRGHGHALSVGGVKAGDRVPQRENPGRKSIQLVIAAPPASGEAVESHLADGFGPLQHAGDPLRQNLSGECKHLGKGMRRLDFRDTEGGQHPPAVLVAE